ncbi:MAG: hypothetical protein ACJAZ3_001344, partial [Sphingobacteriales bacterium]
MKRVLLNTSFVAFNNTVSLVFKSFAINKIAMNSTIRRQFVQLLMLLSVFSLGFNEVNGQACIEQLNEDGVSYNNAGDTSSYQTFTVPSILCGMRLDSVILRQYQGSPSDSNSSVSRDIQLELRQGLNGDVLALSSTEQVNLPFPVDVVYDFTGSIGDYELVPNSEYTLFINVLNGFGYIRTSDENELAGGQFYYQGTTNATDLTFRLFASKDAPVAVVDNASTNEDDSVTVYVLDNDTVGDDLTISAVSQGSNGTVNNLNDDSLSYTPNLNFNGLDTFTYTITDGTLFDTDTVFVTVKPEPETASNNAEDGFYDGDKEFKKIITAGSSPDEANQMVTDALGNNYIVGYFTGNNFSIGDSSFSAEGGRDAFLAKYDSNGVFVFAKHLTKGEGNDDAFGVALDGSNNIYIAGVVNDLTDANSDSVEIGNGDTTVATSSNVATSGSNDPILISYTGDGDFRWANSFSAHDDSSSNGIDQTDGLNQSNTAYGVTITSNGRVYIAGTINNGGSQDYQKIGTQSLTVLAGREAYLASFNSTTGAFIKAVMVGTGSNNEFAFSAISDGNNNVYVGGTYGEASTVGGAGTQSTQGTNHGFLVKYDTELAAIFAKRTAADAGNVFNIGFRLAKTNDSDDLILIGGRFASTGATDSVSFGGNVSDISTVFDTALTVTAGTSTTDGFIAAYDAAGTFQWVIHAARGTGDEHITDVNFASGDTFITATGYYNATATIGDPTDSVFTITGGQDAFVAVFSVDTSKSLISANAITGAGDERANGVAGLDIRKTWLAGRIGLTADFGGDLTTTNASTPGDAFLAQYKGIPVPEVNLGADIDTCCKTDILLEAFLFEGDSLNFYYIDGSDNRQNLEINSLDSSVSFTVCGTLFFNDTATIIAEYYQTNPCYPAVAYDTIIISGPRDTFNIVADTICYKDDFTTFTYDTTSRDVEYYFDFDVDNVDGGNLDLDTLILSALPDTNKIKFDYSTIKPQGGLFNMSMIKKFDNDCTDTTFYTVKVDSQSISTFTADTVCHYDTTTFTVTKAAYSGSRSLDSIYYFTFDTSAALNMTASNFDTFKVDTLVFTLAGSGDSTFSFMRQYPYGAPTDTAGQFVAELIIVTKDECYDTTYFTVTVDTIPTPLLTADTVCFGDSTTFTIKETPHTAGSHLDSIYYFFADTNGFGALDTMNADSAIAIEDVTLAADSSFEFKYLYADT